MARPQGQIRQFKNLLHMLDDGNFIELAKAHNGCNSSITILISTPEIHTKP
jgi:hypothetical protein